MSNVVKVLAATMHTDLYSLGNCCTQWVLSNGGGKEAYASVCAEEASHTGPRSSLRPVRFWSPERGGDVRKDTQQSSAPRTRPIMTPLLCSAVSPLEGSFYSALIPQIHLNSAAITEAPWERPLSEPDTKTVGRCLKTDFGLNPRKHFLGVRVLQIRRKRLESGQ